MLEAPRGFLAVFGGEKADASALTRDFGKEWDIVTHLAIKLVPGAHAFHPSVEAAVNAARQSGVAPDQVARILVSGAQSRTIASGQRPKDMVEAIHSLPYFIASAVADKDFSWIHATPEKIHNPVVARTHGSGRIGPGATVCSLQLELGRNGHDRHQVRCPVHRAPLTRREDRDPVVSIGAMSTPNTVP